MTSTQNLVCDSSTLANFKQWAQAISTFFASAGWVQTADTGQVNWTSIASVPGSGAYVYEVWKPGDALTVFYVKVEYGNVSGTNCPSLRITLSTTTNGAGTASGLILGPQKVNYGSFTAPSAVTQFECNFSGANNRMGVMMWRNGSNNCQQFFAIERSLDSSGAATGTHATLWTCGLGSNGVRGAFQQSLVFAVGVAPGATDTNNAGGWMARVQYLAGPSTAFNNSIPFDTCAPQVGYFDYPCTVCGVVAYGDVTEAVTFTAPLYGTSRTYLPSKAGPFSLVNPFQTTLMSALCMRFD